MLGLDKPGARNGAVAGAIVSVVVAFAPGLVTAIYNTVSFNRNIALEAIKKSKDSADIENVLKMLCERNIIDGDPCKPKAK